MVREVRKFRPLRTKAIRRDVNATGTRAHVSLEVYSLIGCHQNI